MRCSVARSLAFAGLAACAVPASADAFFTYGSGYESFSLPGPLGNSFDTKAAVLADGRLVAVSGRDVLVEDSAGSRTFSVGATLDGLTGDVDPSFIEVSPSGSTLAIGAGFGLPVITLETSGLNTAAPASIVDGVGGSRYFQINHFDAAWRDDTTLAITSGDFIGPSVVDTLDVVSGASTRVIDGILGGSAGIAFDNAGRLYTGNGFDFGPGGSGTGTLKAFDLNGGVQDFESSGTVIGEVLSAASLDFDLDGNLFVGGGDFGAGDSGYFGVLSAGSIASALSGNLGPSELRMLDPRGDGLGFYAGLFDRSSGTLFIADGTTLYATVPAPSSVVPVLVGAGLFPRRRR